VVIAPHYLRAPTTVRVRVRCGGQHAGKGRQRVVVVLMIVAFLLSPSRNSPTDDAVRLSYNTPDEYSRFHARCTIRTPPVVMPPVALTTSQQARLSYIGISTIVRRTLHASTRARQDGRYSPADFTSGFTGYYEPGDTEGPLRDTSNIGVPRITPRVLKTHLDQFVVGQERAKKLLSVAVYNHYQRIQELQRRHEEEEELLEQRARRSAISRHPVEGG